MSRSACVTNQNLSVPRALTFSPGFFTRVVRANSLRTSGFSEICSAVSGINYESHQCAIVSATCCAAELAGEIPGATYCALRRLHPAPQHFSDAPRLRDATAGQVWFVRIINFADCAQPVVAQMDRERFQKFTGAPLVIRVNFQPGVDEGSDQPGPNCSLMISTITRAQIAGVNRFVFWIIGRKRTQSKRGEQFVLRNIDNGLPAFLIEHRVVERDGKKLVWTAGNIVCFFVAVAINNVVKISAVGEPETLIE